jgi:hypothetical protein
MEYGEVGHELGQQPINSRSKYDAYKRLHDGTLTTHDGNMKMWMCIVVYTCRTHEGHTNATRCIHDVVLRVQVKLKSSPQRVPGLLSGLEGLLSSLKGLLSSLGGFRKMLWGWPFICPRYHDTWERLELLKCCCFRRHRDPISMYGIARASRSHVAFLRQSGSFLFTSYCLREAKNARWHRWSHEVKTKVTRFDKMPSLWPNEGQNGHTNSTRKWNFARSFGNLLACQRFCHRSRSCCRSLRNSSGGHTMA